LNKSDYQILCEVDEGPIGSQEMTLTGAIGMGMDSHDVAAYNASLEAQKLVLFVSQ
jgi:hypothetical protein